MKGQGQLSTPARASGHRGMYGHGQWKGKIIWKGLSKCIIWSIHTRDTRDFVRSSSIFLISLNNTLKVSVMAPCELQHQYHFFFIGFKALNGLGHSFLSDLTSEPSRSLRCSGTGLFIRPKVKTKTNSRPSFLIRFFAELYFIDILFLFYSFLLFILHFWGFLLLFCSWFFQSCICIKWFLNQKAMCYSGYT